jgi:hypothetical protein
MCLSRVAWVYISTCMSETALSRAAILVAVSQRSKDDRIAHVRSNFSVLLGRLNVVS